ncbi:MAG: hypothetical protein ABI461_12870, partial [Polyangiaceae bacterium]
MKRLSIPALLVAFAALFFSTDASAHQAGLSRGEYKIDGSDVAVSIIFSNTEISAAIAALDSDHDGRVSMAELDAEHD